MLRDRKRSVTPANQEQRLGVVTPPDKQISGKRGAEDKKTASTATLQHRSAAINLGGKQQLQRRFLDGLGSQNTEQSKTLESDTRR
jgi:hypothetical protein